MLIAIVQQPEKKYTFVVFVFVCVFLFLEREEG